MEFDTKDIRKTPEDSATEAGIIKAMMIFAVAILTIFALAGCSVGARVEKGVITEPIHQSSVQTHQHESFLRLVLFVRHHHGSKPTENLVLTAQTHVYNAGFTRQCRGGECFFVYRDKEVVVGPEFVQIRRVGSRDYVKFYNMEVAMRVIYDLHH
jgi:hypothetical protein